LTRFTKYFYQRKKKKRKIDTDATLIASRHPDLLIDTHNWNPGKII